MRIALAVLILLNGHQWAMSKPITGDLRDAARALLRVSGYEVAMVSRVLAAAGALTDEQFEVLKRLPDSGLNGRKRLRKEHLETTSLSKAVAVGLDSDQIEVLKELTSDQFSLFERLPERMIRVLRELTDDEIDLLRKLTYHIGEAAKIVDDPHYSYLAGRTYDAVHSMTHESDHACYDYRTNRTWVNSYGRCIPVKEEE